MHRDPMAEHEERLSKRIAEKIHGDSSSSSDSDDDKPSQGHVLTSRVYRLFGREKPIHQVLGAGKPADVLLWRNKKTSGNVLGGATALWVLFEMLEYHLITLVCHILILSLAILFLWSNASNFINKSPPNIPELVLPEKCVLEVATALTVEINRALDVVRDIASGRDLRTFLGVIAGLWFVSLVGKCCNFLTLFYIIFVLVHTLPVLYEKYEDKVDSFSEKAMVEIKKQYAVFDEKVLSKILKGPLKEKKKH
ncbi:hypothetical protein DITRI_Ditri07aG0090500 [Diplodiscus trichospermus]